MNSFTWRVADGGYRWYPYRKRRHGEGCLAPAGGWKYRLYEPLKEYTGLFRTFAFTPTTEKGILGFANQYGHLGDMPDPPEGFPDLDEFTEEDWDRYDAAQLEVEPCENFWDWESNINAVRGCVEAWDRVRRGEGDDDLLETVRKRVDREFRCRVQPRLLPDVRGGLTVEYQPENLLGAIWLQLALAMAGEKKYRACAFCGRPFELTPDLKRADAQYCKEACRSRAYRARRDKAVELAAGGKTVKQIARELGSDVQTVRGWLARAKEK
jgi:hypothetical protein